MTVSNIFLEYKSVKKKFCAIKVGIEQNKDDIALNLSKKFEMNVKKKTDQQFVVHRFHHDFFRRVLANIEPVNINI
jgi:hypothetical protein